MMNIQIKNLFESPLPNVVFENVVTKSSSHISNHQPATNLNIELPGLINIDIRGNLIEKDEISDILNYFKRIKYLIRYASKSSIRDLTKRYLMDIMRAVELLFPEEKIELDLVEEASVSRTINTQETDVEEDVKEEEMKSKTKNCKSDIPDIWLVKVNGRPICIIEIMSPGCPLDDPRIIGQMYDDLMQLFAFFGQSYIFGILTTFEEWKFTCLDNSLNYYMQNDCIIPPHSEIQPISTIRQLYGSEKIKYTNPLLSKFLLSIIFKSWKSPCSPVPLLQVGRQYLVCSEASYKWVLLTDHLLNEQEKKITLYPPNKRTKCFIVLRYFHKGADGDVFLGMSFNGNICVIKHFYDSKDCDQEFAFWNKLWDKKVFKMILSKRPSLVMPYVYQCHSKNNGEIFFEFDLRKWGFFSQFDPESDSVFLLISQTIEELALDLTPKIVAENAINTLIEANLQHDDVEWRHVALLPKFDNEKQIIGLQSILIDLTRMHEIKENELESAKFEMLSKLE